MGSPTRIGLLTNINPTERSQFKQTTGWWSGWWLTYPSEKYEFVNWDHGIPHGFCFKPCSSHHQAVINMCSLTLWHNLQRCEVSRGQARSQFLKNQVTVPETCFRLPELLWWLTERKTRKLPSIPTKLQTCNPNQWRWATMVGPAPPVPEV